MTKYSFDINAKQAYKDLSTVFRAINHSTVLPILEDVLIEGIGDFLSITSTDLQNTATVLIESDSLFSPICINAKSLRSVIANSISELITLSGDDKKISIKSGRFALKYQLEQRDQFPKNPEIQDGVSAILDAKQLCTQFRNARPYISNDDLRPAMTGVYFCDWGGKLSIIATDAHRMYFNKFTETPIELKDTKSIIPNRSVMLFLEMFKDGEIEVAISDKFIKFSQPKRSLICRLIEARYPQFEVVIISPEFTFNLLRKDISSFLKIASDFTNKSTKQLNVNLSSDDLSFEGGDLDFDYSFDYKLPVYNISKQIPTMSFGVNLNFLHQSLAVNKNDEYVKISHSGHPHRAMIIDDCVLIMPLMTNK